MGVIRTRDFSLYEGLAIGLSATSVYVFAD